MRQTLKRLLRMVTGYGAIQWAGPFISFIFTPIITRILSPADYGVADFVLTVASALGTLALFAQPQALTAHFNDKPADAAWQRTLTGSSIALSICIGIPISLLVFLFAAPIANITFPGYTHLYQIISLTVVFGIISGILTAAAQAALRVRWGMVLSLVAILGTVGGNVLYIIILRLGATGMVLTGVSTGIAMSVAALLMMRRQLSRPNPVLIRLLLVSGALLLPNMIAAWVLNVVDRFFLIQYVSTDSLGHYAIANKFASLLGVFMSPLYLAWTPLALSVHHDPRARERLAILSKYIIAIALFAGLALGLFASEILIVLTRAPYLPAAPYVGFLAYVHVFGAFGTILYTSALAEKRLKAISLTTIVGAVVNIALNFVLIPPFGVWGATIATVIGYAVPMVLLYIVLRKQIEQFTLVLPYIGALAAQLILLVIGNNVPAVYFPIRILMKLGLLAILPVSFVLLRIAKPAEIQQAVVLLKSIIVDRFARVKSAGIDS